MDKQYPNLQYNISYIKQINLNNKFAFKLNKFFLFFLLTILVMIYLTRAINSFISWKAYIS